MKCDLKEHKFLITSYESCKLRFEKLNEFNDLLFIPENCSRVNRIIFFYKLLKKADIIIWHSLFFTTKKYIYFLYIFRNFLKKSVWIEWNADLYMWQYKNKGYKNRIRNYINKMIRNKFKYIGCCFFIDCFEVYKQFGKNVVCFDTPMPNPKKNPTELIELINALKPSDLNSKDKRINVQIAHNAFSFNNHKKLINYLEIYKKRNVNFILPLSYGIYGINGQYGSLYYKENIIKYAKNFLYSNVKDNKISNHFDEFLWRSGNLLILTENMPFEKYVEFLWNIDIAVFDFDRPCGLGTLRILLLMEKKIFLPSGTPYYKFLIDNELPIYDTNKIKDMSFEEFIKPPIYKNKKWILSYLNNDWVMEKWFNMFDEVYRREYK